MRRIATLLAVLLLAGPLAAQTDDGTTFRWSGGVPAAHFIRLHNLNGDVRVEQGNGPQVEVVAERVVKRGDPKSVRFAVRTRPDGDVVVCALWKEGAECTDDGPRTNSHTSWNSRNEISVTMRVRVPAGVKTYARSTNGNVAVDGVADEVDAASTNGDVNVRTRGGPVSAVTTNGSVSASLGALTGTAPMRFVSTNGAVTVTVPSNLSADVEMSTTNGEVVTDFPLTVNGRISARRINGTIGGGGRSLVVRSTNGDVSLLRRGI